MSLPCQLGLFPNLALVWARGSGLHHGVKYLLVLAHDRHSRDLHAHIIQGLSVFQTDAVFLGEGAADGDSEDLGLNRSRRAYGTQVVAIAC